MAINAHGTTLKFTPADGTECTVGRLASIGEIAPDSEEIDVTTLDSEDGYRETMQGFKDAGELELTGYHSKDDNGQAALRAAYETGKAGNVVIAFSDGCTVSFKAYVKSHSIGSAEVDGAVGFGAVLRITGPVSVEEGA